MNYLEKDITLIKFAAYSELQSLSEKYFSLISVEIELWNCKNWTRCPKSQKNLILKEASLYVDYNKLQPHTHSKKKKKKNTIKHVCTFSAKCKFSASTTPYPAELYSLSFPTTGENLIHPWKLPEGHLKITN